MVLLDPVGKHPSSWSPLTPALSHPWHALDWFSSCRCRQTCPWGLRLPGTEYRSSPGPHRTRKSKSRDPRRRGSRHSIQSFSRSRSLTLTCTFRTPTSLSHPSPSPPFNKPSEYSPLWGEEQRALQTDNFSLFSCFFLFISGLSVPWSASQPASQTCLSPPPRFFFLFWPDCPSPREAPATTNRDRNHESFDGVLRTVSALRFRGSIRHLEVDGDITWPQNRPAAAFGPPSHTLCVSPYYEPRRNTTAS